MTALCRLLLIAFTLTAIPVRATSDVASVSLFGIGLDSALTDLPVCVFKEKELHFYGEELCVVIRPEKPGSSPPIWYDINLPTNKPPWLFTTTIYVVDGKIARIQAGTHGNKYQDEVLTALRAKFGKPTILGSDVAQNAFGAHFKRINATWQLPGAKLQLWGTASSVDSGEIRLSTTKYLKLVSDHEAERNAKALRP